MNRIQNRVVVAMSGGVDSSVSAALLVDQGYEVSGIMLRLWSEPGYFSSERDNRCCTRDQMIDAHFVARKLGIPLEIVDVQDQFKSEIVDRFIDGYSSGETPNPCLACNRHIRFGFLLDLALSQGADYLATGHYARIVHGNNGILELQKGIDSTKDQSYVLSVLTQDHLNKVLFPLGTLTKIEVRNLAKAHGLPVASKADSQDLCFIADSDYRRFLNTHMTKKSSPGRIKLVSGQDLGEHAGLVNYTIGQRKGLGISWSEPLYVIDKQIETNTLVVGTRRDSGEDSFFTKNTNWLDGHPPETILRASVKTRYKSHPVPGQIEAQGAATAFVALDKKVSDITPGQGAVFYLGDKVLGSGIICKHPGQ